MCWTVNHIGMLLLQNVVWTQRAVSLLWVNLLINPEPCHRICKYTWREIQFNRQWQFSNAVEETRVCECVGDFLAALFTLIGYHVRNSQFVYVQVLDMATIDWHVHAAAVIFMKCILFFNISSSFKGWPH